MKCSTMLLTSVMMAGSATTAWAQQAVPAAEPTADTAAASSAAAPEPSVATPEVAKPAPVQQPTVVVKEPEADESVVGKIGVGYFTTSAPVGIRRWASESWGYDLGIGFGLETETQPDTAWSGNIEAGVLYSLAQLENIIVFVRGGVGVGLRDTGAAGRDMDFMVNLNAILGGEFFLTALGFPNLSFTGGVGAQLGIIKPDGGDTQVQVGTISHGVDIVSSTALTGVLGFHIYF